MADGGVAVREYWASVFNIRELAPRAMERMKFHRALLQRTGRLSKMRSMLAAYYGLGTDESRDTSKLGAAGDEGEVVELTTNQVRPIITNALSLIAGQKIETKTRAQNEDASTLAQTRLAQALLEAVELSSSTQEREVDCVRGGLIASSWCMGQAWRPKDGKEWSRDENGQPLFDGDISEFVLAPWHVAFDASATNDTERKWCLFCKPESRYDLAAQFDVEVDEEQLAVDPADPESASRAQQVKVKAARSNAIARKIRQSSSGVASSPVPAPYDSTSSATGSGVSALDALLGDMRNPEDTVWVWELRHLKTPALPEGRLIRFIEPDIVLWDSMEQGVAYPYDELHMFEFCPERVVSGGQGHTGAFDLGALQEFVDICTASIASTVNINGQNSFWQKGTTAPQLNSLSNSSTVLISEEKPEVLEFPALKGEVLQAAEWAISTARQSMALNDVVMGAPPKGMPAQAQALQRAQAQQYHAVAQAERVRLRKQNANGKLKLMKRFARSPRVTKLAGKARVYEVKSWQAKDIADVDFVDIETVDPVFGSFEGRQSIFDYLMKMNAFQGRPDAAITFLQTGSLATITSTQTAQRELVEANVALLQQGIGLPQVDLQKSMPSPENPNGEPIFLEPAPGTKVLRILKSDPHHLAIPAYLGVLSSPGCRGDAKIMEACEGAIKFSMQLWAQLTPDEAGVFGIPPLPSQMMMAGMPPGGAPAPGGDGAEPGAEQPNPTPQDEQGIKMPSPPPNPLDGSQESSASTGLSQ